MTGRIVLKLDQVMAERGRSLIWLAGRVGITNVNLSKIKNNRVAAIRFSTLAAICEALDCTPGDILSYEPADPANADDSSTSVDPSRPANSHTSSCHPADPAS